MFCDIYEFLLSIFKISECFIFSRKHKTLRYFVQKSNINVNAGSRAGAIGALRHQNIQNKKKRKIGFQSRKIEDVWQGESVAGHLLGTPRIAKIVLQNHQARFSLHLRYHSFSFCSSIDRCRRVSIHLSVDSAETQQIGRKNHR